MGDCIMVEDLYNLLIDIYAGRDDVYSMYKAQICALFFYPTHLFLTAKNNPISQFKHIPP